MGLYADAMTMPPRPPQHPYPTVQPMNPQDEKMWATLTHVSGILFYFLGPLVIYLVLRERGPFIRAHSATALNFQLTVLIAALVCIPLSFFGIGILLLIGVGIYALIIEIVAAVKASQGQWYTAPLSIPFVS
ncbi:hypothetical protein BWL13_02595 [Microbacterium oleivorans]|nr:hypothetical protein BWL13_02595 [Microbacterium oleivorans]